MSNPVSARKCPICDSQSKEVIIKIDFELFEGHPMDKSYNVVQCRNCGFVFADLQLSQDGLNRYYADLSRYEDSTISYGNISTGHERDRLTVTAALISSHIKDKNVRIIDLGCATGGLLNALKIEGFTNLTGIDPSAVCVGIVKKQLGCDCFQHSIFDIPEDIGQFDLVTITHVLEHVIDVRKTIEIIDRLLKPGGAVYIETPNAMAYKNVIHAPLQEFNTEHIEHFTQKAFLNLMGSFGYRDIVMGTKVYKIFSDQDYPAVYGLFRKEEGYQRAIQFDDEIRNNIQEYIDKSNKILDGIKQILETLPKDEPIALFGMGQFAFKLMKTGAFQNARGIKLFDNSMPVGKKVMGITILPGSDILKEFKKEKFSLVITSLIHEVSIKKGISDIFIANNEEPPIMVGFSHLLTN